MYRVPTAQSSPKTASLVYIPSRKKPQQNHAEKLNMKPFTKAANLLLGCHLLPPSPPPLLLCAKPFPDPQAGAGVDEPGIVTMTAHPKWLWAGMRSPKETQALPPLPSLHSLSPRSRLQPRTIHSIPLQCSSSFYSFSPQTGPSPPQKTTALPGSASAPIC